MNLAEKRAIVLAMHFQNIPIDDSVASLEAAVEYWKSQLAEQGLNPDQVSRIVAVDSSSFAKEIAKGEFVDVVKSIADPALLRWGAITAQEVEGYKKMSEKPAGSTAAAKPVGEFDALPVGTKITVQGSTWKGFVAEITGDEGSFYAVKTTLKKGGEWTGRIRKSSVEGLFVEQPPAEAPAQ